MLVFQSNFSIIFVVVASMLRSLETSTCGVYRRAAAVAVAVAFGYVNITGGCCGTHTFTRFQGVMNQRYEPVLAVIRYG